MTSLARIAVAMLTCAAMARVNSASTGEASDSGQQAAKRVLQAMKVQSQPGDWAAACKAMRQDWKTANLPVTGATIGGYWLDPA